MKFLKSTILTGLFVLLPLMLLWIGLREIGGLLAGMAEPIADIFPSAYFDELKWPGVIAVLLITAAAFAIGLLARLPPVSYVAQRFESSILYRVPMYKMLKVISTSLVSSERATVSAALLISNDRGGEPCYIMERHANGMATILLPWSPASFAGSIKIVSMADLKILDCSVDEFSRSISFMGIGIEDCLKPSARDKQE